MKDNLNNCNEIKILFSSYIDEELNEEEKLQVEEHLNTCQNCAAEVDQIKQLSNKIQSSLIIEAPFEFDLSQNILDRLSTTNKITCEQVNENLSAYFDGELEPSVYYLIEEHLNNCDICHQKYKRLETVRNLIKLSVDALDVDLWNTVYYRLISSKELECTFVLDEISAYIDKELDLELTKSITDHVMSCEQCHKDLLKKQKLLKHIQKAMLNSSKNIDLWPKVYHRLTHSHRQKTFVWSAAASFLMVCLVWTVLSVVFPTDNIYIDTKPAIATKTNTGFSRTLPVNDTDYVAKSMNTPESYLFSNVYDVPPSGVMPVLYDEGGEVSSDK